MNRIMTRAYPPFTLCSPRLFSTVPPGGPPPIDRRNNADRIRQQDMSSREWQLRNFGTEPRSRKIDRQIKALMAQTEEDFTPHPDSS